MSNTTPGCDGKNSIRPGITVRAKPASICARVGRRSSPSCSSARIAVPAPLLLLPCCLKRRCRGRRIQGRSRRRRTTCGLILVSHPNTGGTCVSPAPEIGASSRSHRRVRHRATPRKMTSVLLAGALTFRPFGFRSSSTHLLSKRTAWKTATGDRVPARSLASRRARCHVHDVLRPSRTTHRRPQRLQIDRRRAGGAWRRTLGHQIHRSRKRSLPK